MRPDAVVIFTPGLDLLTSILQAQEPVCVQTLLTEPRVERLDGGVVGPRNLGVPGRLKSSFTLFQYAHRSKSFEMNSGPLSTWIDDGKPCSAVTRSSTSTTSIPLIRGAACNDNDSRVQLSTSVNTRNRRPSNNWSDPRGRSPSTSNRSYSPPSAAPPASRKTPCVEALSDASTILLLLYNRYTRLALTSQPSRRSSTCRRR